MGTGGGEPETKLVGSPWRPRDVRAWLLAPPPPTETAPWWDAGGHVMTLVFWASLAVAVAALFRQRLLALMDYPQHLALAGILHRMASSGSHERALYDTNLASFNSLFHVVVAALAFILPIERAGEAVLGLSFVLLGVAMLRLLAVTGRPRGACARRPAAPVLGTRLAWGFGTFTLAFAIQMLVLSRVIEAPRVSRDRRLRFDVATATLALLGMWGHLFASMIAYALMLAAILSDAVLVEVGPARRLGRALRGGLPLLPALVYVVWSFKSQPHMGDSPLLGDNTQDAYAWDKMRMFFDNLNGLRADHLDAKLALIGAAAVAASWGLQSSEGRAARGARGLFPAALLLYLILPQEMWGGTWAIYQRSATAVGMTFLVTVPGVRRSHGIFSAIFAFVGLAGACSLFQLMGTSRAEFADLDRVLDEAPSGRRVVGLIWGGSVPGYAVPRPFQHFPAYYVARKEGQVAVQFTDFLSLPVHYKPGKRPVSPDPFFEWKPGDYDPAADYASVFDLALVRTETRGEDPRVRVLGEAGRSARVRAHHGQWWLIETRGPP